MFIADSYSQVLNRVSRILYLSFLYKNLFGNEKDQYGFEFAMFSFNESDLGINVRQTAEEHAAFIKGLGAYLESRGINTKLLLGDTADADDEAPRWGF